MSNPRTGESDGRRPKVTALATAAIATVVYIVGTAYAIAGDGEADGVAAENGSATIQQRGTESDEIVRSSDIEAAARIAIRVAVQIEELKDKFPHLAKYSATDHLHENSEHAGFAPGTPNNPGLYSIGYYNGVLGRKAHKSSGPKRGAEYTYDPQTGIHLDVHFFIGESRGNDPRIPYKIGDLSVHAYVSGPAAGPIKKEIFRILDELADEFNEEHTDGDAGTSAPKIGEAHPAAGAKYRFSEANELVLSMDSLHFMLDLDTGQTMDPPATARPDKSRMDVCPFQTQPSEHPTGLRGLSLQGLNTKASDWNVSVFQVRRALVSSRKQELAQMPYDPSETATYFFRTRAGTVGILQMLALVEEPQGIRIRYKTIEAVPGNVPAERK
jgi:hypothetical protein